MTADEEVAAAVATVHAAYRQEIAKLQVQLALYRGVIVEAGIEPPDRSAEELLELVGRCSTVIVAAHDVIALLGSATELLATIPWRDLTPKEGVVVNASS